MMEERAYTTLAFGRVELASDSLGTKLRIHDTHDEGKLRSWSEPGIQTDIPIEEGRRIWTREQKIEFSNLVFRRAAADLDKDYPGGYNRAVAEFREWLLADGLS